MEGAFGTTEYTVESVKVNGYLPDISQSALASRFSRQQQRLTSVSVRGIVISSEKEADDFKTLMQAIPPATGERAVLLIACICLDPPAPLTIFHIKPKLLTDWIRQADMEGNRHS